ncbi:magnesium protoporphyrin IX methyltransferase, chloroplastic-like [Impatiens glandulifera]|uniref:magnesium protoporphyrin IX methyltransferase, chloroplastic-like n=1 Tax=Impatiens glandulifera TaxID=253017 RepID=UPI001FB07AB4|nr:magnesium protoporphyrin IX methyltransferase, chloroplastic-like [Impatiens glandulifera]XP_047340698.1 magnesium protoporphyrin IX methyltransferase, chloroplastic-like [Impatiens glandulifera]
MMKKITLKRSEGKICQILELHELQPPRLSSNGPYKPHAKEELVDSSQDSPSVAPVLPKFQVKDLESLDGKYDTVVCLDVLIHYPQNKADGMIAHLASLAENRLILSFAPKTY